MNTVELLGTIAIFAVTLLHGFMMLFTPVRWAALPRWIACREYVGAADLKIRMAGLALLAVVVCFGAEAAGFRVGPISSARPVDWAWAVMIFMVIGGRGLGISRDPHRSRVIRFVGVCLLAISPLLGYAVFVGWPGQFS